MKGVIYLIAYGLEETEATQDINKATKAHKQGHTVKVFDGKTITNFISKDV